MVDYEQLYHLLFNAVTDALEDIGAGNPGLAAERLKAAQQAAEELYLRAGEA